MPRSLPSKTLSFWIFNIEAFKVLDTFRIHRDEIRNLKIIISFDFVIVIFNNNDRFHLLNTYAAVVTLLSTHLIFTQMLGEFYYYPI